MISEAIDTAGVAVITGGASGFGFVVAERLVRKGMAVAILDISEKELAESKPKLEAMHGGKVLAIKCDVTKFDDCVAASKEVAAAFPGTLVSFLFNNAGILGPKVGNIIEAPADVWVPIFSVNVFGAVYIIKAFLPGMVAAGPLPSGKKSFVVTTSSVVGLLNHNPGPYSVSKMAATAVSEQFSLELESMGAKAAHISPHSLHPTMAGTKFFLGRGADGKPNLKDTYLGALKKNDVTTPEEIVDGMFRGLDEGKFYIVVDHPLDIPTSKQIALRMEDQMSSGRPRLPEQLAMTLKVMDPKAFSRRQALLGGQSTASRL